MSIENQENSMFNVMQSLNGEAFMIILAEIWNKWATKQVLVADARWVGINSTTLNVKTMQQDKFELAANCIQNKFSSTAGLNNYHKIAVHDHVILFTY